MRRVLLHHDGKAIPLPTGDTVVGRALECRVRFNDPAVSRMHLRLVVRGGGVIAQNLSTSNGTQLNGTPLEDPIALEDGDVLKIGYLRLRVELVDDPREPRPSAPPTVTLGREAEPGSGILVDEEEIAGEATRPGTGSPAEGLIPISSASVLQALTDGKDHTCPKCRGRCSYFDDTCPRCGYAWPPGRPTSATQEIEVDQVTTRAHPRYPIEVPVVYASETLGIDALVRDLSRGGMFIASDLLDPVGTACELTALPDGHPAVVFQGVVAHVVQAANDHGRPPGLGIQFTGASPDASAWMDRVLGAFERADDDARHLGDPTIDKPIEPEG
jgi:hypothetical protein